MIIHSVGWADVKNKKCHRMILYVSYMAVPVRGVFFEKSNIHCCITYKITYGYHFLSFNLR